MCAVTLYNYILGTFIESQISFEMKRKHWPVWDKKCREREKERERHTHGEGKIKTFVRFPSTKATKVETFIKSKKYIFVLKIFKYFFSVFAGAMWPSEFTHNLMTTASERLPSDWKYLNVLAFCETWNVYETGINVEWEKYK